MVAPWKALSALPALLYLACPADAGAGGYTLHAGALAAGSDLSAGNYTSLAAAEAECDASDACKGFTLSSGADPSATAWPAKVYFKSAVHLNTDGTWRAYTKADDPVLDTCNTLPDIDINPHTPGLGSVPASSIGECCEACASVVWWEKGCRFYTLSKGRCWLKANNGTMAASPGKLSGQATREAPAPAPPPPWPPAGESGWWTKVGPWGIGDDIRAQGEAGTLADAVSPPANPSVIYAGGQNNGASSGVLKSVDGGAHWSVASAGMFNTKVQALGIVDAAGDHVYCAVPGAIYETTDGARSWRMINGSQSLGTCHSFKNGTIGGVPHMFASCDIGVANVPIGGTGEWSVIPPGGWGHAGYLTLSDRYLLTYLLVLSPSSTYSRLTPLLVSTSATSLCPTASAPTPCWAAAWAGRCGSAPW